MCRGYGRGPQGCYREPIEVPSGYSYIGPCRCGHGPDAYYRTPDGRILHASQVSGTPIPLVIAPTKEQEIEQLKAEKEMLERRLKEIDDTLKKVK
ncbi:MAG: hypothetical protein COS08_02120 [Euryarchaeota archaeon CG01_land_8_20_14_3_00_38_12]|nr:MAG: hypothetical protein COS08_02120 [Euryarchaeota archaeon CG01_land_8_20_14_3_00_38_12]PJB21715.1 MAG: hypothetical protein CO114_03895 [Euryarchaeota archaeon CG_4_9_14_3_um_filter_38_12]